MSTTTGPLRLKLTFSSGSFEAGGYQSMMIVVPPTVRTVSDLLHHLQSRPYLSHLKGQCSQWSVSIDGFRLPNESVVREILRDDELVTVDGVPCEEEPSVIYALPPSAGEGDRRIRLDETSTSTPKKRSLREVRKGTPKPKGRAPSSSSDEDMSGESSSESESSSDEEESASEAVKAVAPIAQTQENEPSSPTSSSSSSSSESESSSDESSAASEPIPQPKRRKVEASPAPVQQEVIGNDKVRFVAARKLETPVEEEAKESNWKFDDWHEKVEDLRAGQFVKFRSLQADPVTGRSKLLEPEVWKLLALDNGKAVLVDCKGRHDVIPEKDMFGLLVHDPEENAPSADKPQQQQQKQIGQHVASPANKKGPKISSLAYVPPIASDKAALKRQKKKFGSIRRQVEWWLNKPNWEKDEHLRSLAYPGTHWVPVHELMKFERLRDLSDDQAEVVHVMRTERCGKQDPRLEVSPDGYYVRHKCWVEADTAGGPKTAA
ncbi:hypothetical protein FOZ60_002404 [Perkinsus olseni]|uniref:HTH La-type RNA-binding domain-containing protein n=1 Tax=Perkinsus olseni TaxID=32597 RepID=A0A7J6NY34_PEROL|nr:hypothetical protein FOZ60_002404 [Perkinsus olseni]